MARLNGKGPEEKGCGTGRGLGVCNHSNAENATGIPGKGMGLRRHSGGGLGMGKRLKSGLK